MGAVPKTRWAPTQGLAFRFPARYFRTTSGTSSCRRSLLVNIDVAHCLSEVDFLNFAFVVSVALDDSTWVAVYDEMYIEQDDNTSEQDLSLNWNGYISYYSCKNLSENVIKIWVE